MSTHVLELGRPSVARPILLVFLDPKMKATNSPENAIQLLTHHINGQTHAQALLRMVEREEYLECLGAQVWSTRFEEAPELQR